MDNTIKNDLYTTLTKLGLAPSTFQFIMGVMLEDHIRRTDMLEEVLNSGSVFMAMQQAAKDEKK